MSAAPLRKLSSLGVVVPLFNEQSGLDRFYNVLSNQLRELNLQYTIVFVDDGSSDATLEILHHIAACDPKVTVLSLARNWGHQIALTAGLDHVEAEATVVMDGDLQHPPAVLEEMVRKYESGAEVVYAVRRSSPGVNRLKKLTSDLFYALFERSTELTVVRGAADFRLMSREVVTALRSMREMHRYMRGMVPWLGSTFSIVQYDQGERKAGSPAYTWRKSARLAKDALFSFSTLPLDLLTWCGVVLSVYALFYLIYVLAVLLLGRPVEGWTSVIAVLLILSTVQFLSIAILAKYLGMVFEQTKGRPLYVLKQKHMAEPHGSVPAGDAAGSRSSSVGVV